MAPGMPSMYQDNAWHGLCIVVAVVVAAVAVTVAAAAAL